VASFGVHVEAPGAAIDLTGADLHEFCVAAGSVESEIPAAETMTSRN